MRQAPGRPQQMRQWATCGQAWVALMRHVIDAAEPADDDRGPVIEGPPVLFEMVRLGPGDPLISKFGEATALELYARKFTSTRVSAPFKYSYGARLREFHGVDQLAWVRQLLIERPYSKSGWISLTGPGERNDAVPCLTGLAFHARRQKLNMSAVFRAQNAYTCYLNYLPLRDVQSEMAEGLGLTCGPMRVYVDVPHLYIADADKVQAILSAAPAPEILPGCYPELPRTESKFAQLMPLVTATASCLSTWTVPSSTTPGPRRPRFPRCTRNSSPGSAH
jgi:thymidylate synthase